MTIDPYRLPLVLAVLILLVSTVPFTMADASGDPPSDTNHSIVVGVQGPDDRGMVQVLGPDGTEQWRHTQAGSYHDVSMLEDGRVLASYATDEPTDCGQYDAPCARTGVRVIDPTPEPHVAWQWSIPTRKIANREIHDAELLPNGNLLVVDMDQERVLVVNRSTQEIDWQWNASQYYDAPPDPTRTDWLHMNDVDRISKGRYLVSVRNAFQLVVVNRSCTCVTEVVNEDRDGGRIRGQHNPQWLTGEAVLVADSGNDRVVELHKQDGEWVPAWQVDASRELPFSWPRDADRLPNGNTLITDSRNHRVLEVTPDGQTVAVWQTAALPYEADAISVGEPAQGTPVGTPAAEIEAGTGEGNWPLIGKLYVGLQHAVGLPAWVTQAHLLAWLLAASLLLASLDYELEQYRQRGQTA